MGQSQASLEKRCRAIEAEHQRLIDEGRGLLRAFWKVPLDVRHEIPLKLNKPDAERAALRKHWMELRKKIAAK